MPQLSQADVVVTVPDVAMPVLSPTAEQPGISPCSPTWARPHLGAACLSSYLATKSLLTSRKMKKHSSLGV